MLRNNNVKIATSAHVNALKSQYENGVNKINTINKSQKIRVRQKATDIRLNQQQQPSK